jgi:hypothetical protein
MLLSVVSMSSERCVSFPDKLGNSGTPVAGVASLVATVSRLPMKSAFSGTWEFCSAEVLAKRFGAFSATFGKVRDSTSTLLRGGATISRRRFSTILRGGICRPSEIDERESAPTNKKPSTQVNNAIRKEINQSRPSLLMNKDDASPCIRSNTMSKEKHNHKNLARKTAHFMLWQVE